jgi:hypothetical protein
MSLPDHMTGTDYYRAGATGTSNTSQRKARK